MYYIELPSTSTPMVNGHGIAYNLFTYHGPADIRTMTAANVLTQIVDPFLQMGPITLKNADFNLAAANIYICKHGDLLNSKILQLGFKQICAAMFKQLCPSNSNQPHMVIEHICQCHDSSRVFPTPPERVQAFCLSQDIVNQPLPPLHHGP